jgi:hypothetical protein
MIKIFDERLEVGVTRDPAGNRYRVDGKTEAYYDAETRVLCVDLWACSPEGVPDDLFPGDGHKRVLETCDTQAAAIRRTLHRADTWYDAIRKRVPEVLPPLRPHPAAEPL